MKRLGILIVSLLLLCSSLSAQLNPSFMGLLDATEQNLLYGRSHFTVSYNIDNAPLEYVDAAGNAQGVAKAYLDAISERTGITFSFEGTSRHVAAEEYFTTQLSYDLLLSLNATSERQQHYVFTEPYLRVPIVLLAKSQVGYVGSLEELDGRRVAAIKDSAVSQWIKTDYPHVLLVDVLSPAEGLAMVQRGSVFAMVGNLVVLNHHLTSLGMTDSLKVVGITPYTNTLSIAVSNDLAPLVSILNIALGQIDEDERMQLHRQTLPMWYRWAMPRQQMFIVSAITFVLLILAVLWIITLTIQRKRRERAEAKLVHSEQRFRLLFEEAPVALQLISYDRKILATNTWWHMLFGYPKEELADIERWFNNAFIDTKTRALISERWQLISDAHKTGAEVGELSSFEATMTCWDGSSRIVQIGSTLLSDAMLVTFFDLSEHKQILQEVSALHRQAEHARALVLSALEDQQISERSLQQSNAMLDAAINSMIDAVYILDAQGRFILSNQAFYEYYHFNTPEECPPSLGDFKGLFEVYSEEGKRLDSSEWVGYRALAGQKGTTSYSVLKQGHDERWFGSYSYAPIYGEEREIAGAVVVCRDITEERKIQQQLLFQRDHDFLTGLYSRAYFEGAIQAYESCAPLSVGLVDINGLKLINDSLGHSMGDELIKKTADLLSDHRPEGMIVARYGGDEFVFVLPDDPGEEIQRFIRKIEKNASFITFENFHLSLSFGWAARQSLGESVNQTLNRADAMMAQNKIYESASAKSKSIGLLMNSLFAKSRRESSHSRRVGALCAFLAQQLDLSAREVNRIRTAGLMHDIGKIGISETILNKPGSLNDEQWQEMRRHPEIGYRVLNAVSEFSDLALAILEHHERWDGSGYPRGLKGERISYQARIIAIADSYDAMTSERSYRSPISKEAAREEIWKNRGILYDPDIVQVFVSTIDQFSFKDEQ
ncbi:MAG: HD domain-containing phosphohydrolase [Sphaerochaeta sp.]